MANVSLLSNNNYIQTPYIKVVIGDYEFGVYNKNAKGLDKYPNFVKELTVTKINGQVNTYTLSLNYQITEYDDPNYFEKVLSSVSSSRKIVFTYGDMSLPTFVYKNEEAIITKVTSNVNIRDSSISYTIDAVSQGNLLSVGSYNFPARLNTKPSTVIYELLRSNQYGLKDLFSGMRNENLVRTNNLIPTTDCKVDIKQKVNTSILEYLQYLVSIMTPSKDVNYVSTNSVYIMTFQDDTSGIYNGSYFKITQIDNAVSHPEAYELDIGYPSSNLVSSFDINQNENYSIYYEYQKKLNDGTTVSRYNKYGVEEEVYAPVLSSKNSHFETDQEDINWWSKVTQYPIKASITIMGLIRPAVLMSYLRLNTYFYGNKHISSGLWIITKQQDKINGSGFYTTLDMVKVSGD